MSELDKLARQLKAARKELNNVRADYETAKETLSECSKAVNNAARAIDEIRARIVREAEGADPVYGNYV